MVNFDELQKRVEAAGGAWIVSVESGINMAGLPGLSKNKLMLHNEGNLGMEPFIALINGYLDGLEAKDKARRCVDAIEVECDEDNPGARFCATEIGAGRICQDIIRREFGIEEEK